MNKLSNMFTHKFFIELSVFFVMVFFTNQKLNAQSTQGIYLNEYSASNGGTMAITDSYGKTSDWVELSTSQSQSVSLQSYYLSNDRNNLYKWQFPSNFVIAPGGYRIVWLSGRNTVTSGGEVHASFDLTQCKNQWLILSTSAGVVRDSVFVQKTQLGHSRVRIQNNVLGIGGWRVSTVNTFSLANPSAALSFKDYLPTPQFECNAAVYTPGLFCNVNSEVRIKVNGLIADTVRDCFSIHFTRSTVDQGNYPTASHPVYDSLTSNLLLLNTEVFRAVAYTNTATAACLGDSYLPSFCQTNTFFYDQEYTQFQQEFGIVSITTHSSEAGWFAGGGSAPLSPTIHVEYFDKNQVTEGYSTMYRPVQESWKTAQQGIYMTMDDRKGFGCDFNSPTFNYPIFNVAGLGTSPRTSFPTLHLYAGDFESNSLLSPLPGTVTAPIGTGIRDVFYQSLATKNNLNVNPLHTKPVIAFINGRYQGVYNLREVFDQHYEAYYNNQARDSTDVNILYNSFEAPVTQGDGAARLNFTPLNSFNTDVHFPFVTQYKPLNNTTFYNQLMSKLDKQSFIDYFVLGTYAMNNDFWTSNVAFARGNQVGKPGTKWHYYLLNMPTIFSFSLANTSNGTPPLYPTYNYSPCVNMYPSYATATSLTVAPLTNAFNGHGNVMWRLMVNSTANPSFKLEYLNRYQDLLNGPLRCDNILAHFDYIQTLYKKEMRYQEDPSSTPMASPYASVTDNWDTNMVRLRKVIFERCKFMTDGLKKCYPNTGPYPITVDVRPVGSGSVQLNTVALPYYKWTGSYFPTTLSFKAIPTSSLYAFHHWEFKVHQPLNGRPLSADSVAIAYAVSAGNYEEVVAVFTDKLADITQNGEGANMPSAFSPNNDNINDTYKPLGSAAFAQDYDFRIYNRWGQEVFRTTDPNTGWDGIYNGQQSQTGVYAWIITYKNVFNDSKLAKGNVTLVR